MAILRYSNEITWAGPGSPGVNVFHARQTSGGASPDTINQVMVDFYDAIKGLLNNGTQVVVGASVVDVDTQEFISVTPVTVTGTGGTSRAPELLQLVCSWRTSLAARRGMGRTFLGPMDSSTLQVDGTITELDLATVRTAAEQLVTDSENLGLGALGVYGYQNAAGPGGRDPEDPKVLRDFTGVLVRDRWSYLSSRRG